MTQWYDNEGLVGCLYKERSANKPFPPEFQAEQGEQDTDGDPLRDTLAKRVQREINDSGGRNPRESAVELQAPARRRKR
jgi:hypothetical protein